MVVLTIVCAAACAVLVLAEWRQLALLRIAAKVIASLAFLGVGILGAGDGAYDRWVVAGLALGVAGDIALLGKGKRAFLAGLGVFLAGHVAYVIAFAQLESPQHWLAQTGYAAALPVVVGGVVLWQLWSRLGAMRVPVIAYMLVIAAMVIGALAVRGSSWLMYSPWHASGERVALGAVLFFASDIAVARDKFVGSSFTNKAWGLPAYYAAQLLIAWSLTY